MNCCEDCGKELYFGDCLMCMTKFIKPEKVYKIYRIEIKETGHFYIGYTGMKGDKRFKSHKSRCFSKTDSYRNSDFYLKVRELGITSDTFFDKVEETIIIGNISVLERAKAIESIVISKHMNNELCLNEKL